MVAGKQETVLTPDNAWKYSEIHFKKIPDTPLLTESIDVTALLLGLRSA